ncbi:probable nucleoporin Nup54 [Bradysia coprophila]|uniref:probable nucleoporin Nup54 n=1 Tax=Bradysia coprophila TaxID=38358 RepID=UPI00187D88FD|nr:probable nucleoporin Nup54 [Bradysia coprophila]
MEKKYECAKKKFAENMNWNSINVPGQAAAQEFGTGFGMSTSTSAAQFGLETSTALTRFGATPASSAPTFNSFGGAGHRDERDTVIAKWNYLQAMYGTGKAYYSQSAAPIEITPKNYLCRFKAFRYTKLFGNDNRMGHLSLVFSTPVNQVKDNHFISVSNYDCFTIQKHLRSSSVTKSIRKSYESYNQQQLVNQLNQVLGNKPTLTVKVDRIVQVTDYKSELMIFVEEKSQTSTETKKILATELCDFLNQPMISNKVTGMGVDEVIAMVLPDEETLVEYLDNPPEGINPRMWKHAKQNHPDSTKFIPVSRKKWT